MKMRKGLVVLMVLVSLLGTAIAASTPAYTINNTSSQKSSAVPWSGTTNMGTSTQIQAQVVSIWSRIRKRVESAIHTTGIVLDEVGDVVNMTKRLSLTTSLATLVMMMKMDQTSPESAFVNFQSLFDGSDNLYTIVTDARAEVKGPGDPGTTIISQACGMKTMLAQGQYDQTIRDPDFTREVLQATA